MCGQQCARRESFPRQEQTSVRCGNPERWTLTRTVEAPRRCAGTVRLSRWAGGACWSQGPAGPQPVAGAAHSFVGDVYVLTLKVCQTTPEAAGCSGRTLGLSCPFLGSAGLFAPGSRRPLRPPPEAAPSAPGCALLGRAAAGSGVLCMGWVQPLLPEHAGRASGADALAGSGCRGA